mgnify:CR=1 FL=1
MASLTYRGDAQSQAQVNTVTVGGTYANGQVYTVTMNRKEVAYTSVSGDSNTTVATALQALLAASIEQEFAEVIWTVSGLVITGTAYDPGVPFTNTSSATGTGTLVTATTTASAGPYDWSTADNWSGGSVPVNSDDVTVAGTAGHIRYGLDQNAVTLTGLVFAPTWSGDVGLPDYNGNYYEYRDRYLKIKVNGTVNVNCGSGLMRLNLSSQAATIQVDATGSPTSAGLPALSLLGTGSNTLNVLSGSWGVAIGAGETSTITTVRQGSGGARATDATGTLGSGCTLTTVNVASGTLEINANSTTLNLTDGEVTIKGAATLGTLNADGGTVYYQSTGTLTTNNLGTGAKIDYTRDSRSRTVTNTTMAPGSTLLDPTKSVTFTNPILLSRCGLSEVTLDLGANISIQRS